MFNEYDFNDLKRSSRIASRVTLAGALCVLASISFAMLWLSSLESQLADERKQVTSLTNEKNDQMKQRGELKATINTLRGDASRLQDEIKFAAKGASLGSELYILANSIKTHEKDPPKIKPQPLDQIREAVAGRVVLENQLILLRKEAAIIRDNLRRKFSDPQKNLEMWANLDNREIITMALVGPRSTYLMREEQSSPTGKWYDFTLTLGFPADAKLTAVIKRDIKSVTYAMNHPYLKVAPLVSHTADNDFEVVYPGPSTIRNVVVEIDVAGIGIVTLDFDLTKAQPKAKKK